MTRGYSKVGGGSSTPAASTHDIEWEDDFVGTAPKASVALVTSGSYLYGAGVYGDKRWSFASITAAGAAGAGYGTNVENNDGGRGPGYTVAIRKGHTGVLILGNHASANSIFLGEKASASSPTFGELWNPIEGDWELEFEIRVGNDSDPSFGNTDTALWGIAQWDSNPPRSFVVLGNTVGFSDQAGYAFFHVFSDGDRTYFNTNYSTSIPADTKIKFVNFIRSGGVEVVDTGVEAYNSGGVGEAYWRRCVIRRKSANANTIYFQVYDETVAGVAGAALSSELSSSFDDSQFDGSTTFGLASPVIGAQSAEVMIDKVKFWQDY
jgi:hypothetical protein